MRRMKASESMWKLLRNCSLAVLLLCPLSLMADGNSGTEDIFAYGAGARAIAMGRTFVGLADDVSTIYWNPAGLYNLDKKTISVYYSQLFEGSMYGYIGYVHPTVDYGSFGLGVMSLYTGDIQGYDSSSYQLSTFSSTKMKLILSYANQLPWFPLSFGASVKMNLSSIESYSATSINFDLALHYNFLKRFFKERVAGRGDDDTEFQIGLVFHNLLNKIGERLNLEEDEENYTLVIGASFLKRLNPIIATRILADFSLFEKRPMIFSLGAEITLYRDYFVRFGFALESGFSFGGGIRLAGWTFDYALGFRELGAAHNVSLTWRFGKGRVDLLRAREKVVRKRIRKNILIERSNQEKKYSRIITKKEQDFSKNIRKKDEIIKQRDRRIAAIERERKEQLKKVEQRIQALKQRSDERLARYRERLERTIRENTRQIQAIQKQRDAEVKKLKADMAKQAQLLDAAFAKRMGNLEDAYKKRLAGISLTNQMARKQLTLKYEREKGILKQQETDKAKEYMKGLEEFFRGAYDRALTHFRNVLRRDPGYADAREYMNKIQAQGRDIASYSKQILRYYRQGVGHYLAGRHQRAIAIWQEILKIDPYNKLALKNIEMAKKRLHLLKQYNKKR